MSCINDYLIGYLKNIFSLAYLTVFLKQLLAKEIFNLLKVMMKNKKVTTPICEVMQNFHQFVRN